MDIEADKEFTEKRVDSFSSLTAPKFQDENFNNIEEDSNDLFKLTEDEVKVGIFFKKKYSIIVSYDSDRFGFE